MANYPSGVSSFTTKNSGDTIQGSHINDLQAEVTAIENALLNGFAHNLSITGGLSTTAAITSGTSISSATLATSGVATFGGTVTLGNDVPFYVSHLGSGPSGNYALTRLYYSGNDALLQQIVGGTGVAGDFYIATIATKKLRLGADSTAINFIGYGAGTLSSDGSGNVTSASDGRLKDRIAPLPYGLAEVLQLKPVQYGWREDSGMETEGLYGGFIAQDVQAVMPLAVGINIDKRLTLADRPIIGALVHAVQTLTARLQTLEAA